MKVFNKRYRNLTIGEIDMLKALFSDSIDYGLVKIYRDKFLLFQKTNVAISPNGNIYFDEKHHKDDFSLSSNSDKMWFIHEMTHVWQYQNGFKLIKNALKLSLGGKYKKNRAYCYDDKCVPEPFCAFNFEQQATIVEHYFGAKYLCIGKYLSKLSYLENNLSEFLKNPKDKTLIPSNKIFD
ncbi:MAG: type IV secretion protein Rhs [Epsilonproteobacteria bacterium]|nr:type IV secretion protein Rhs [Campylobacterota bacterium]